MKQFPLLLLILLAALLGGCSVLRLGEAAGVDKRFVESFNRADVDGVMQNYWNSPELVVVAPDGTLVRGWEGARGLFSKMLADMPGARIELSEQEYRVEGDIVYGWGSWKLAAKGADGKPQELRGRYTEILARRDGRMVYILDHPAMFPTPPSTK